MQAALWMLISCLLFALMGHFVKLASPEYSSFELMFYRSFGSLMLISGMLIARGISIKTTIFKGHLLRSCFGLMAMLTYFYALTHLPVPTAITLNYTSPLFLGLFSFFITRQRNHRLTWISVIVGFIGILVLLRPEFSKDTWLAALIGLSSGFMAAIAYTHIQQLGRAKEPALRVVFYFSLIATLGSAFLATATSGWNPITTEMAPILLAIGLCGGGAQWLITKAYSVGNSLAMGAIGFTTIVFSSLITTFTLHETLDLWDYSGQALIILSGLLSLLAERKKSLA